MNRYVIVGNGAAGTTAAEAIRKLDREGAITMVTDEGMAFYWRIRLNEFIAGEIQEKELLAKKEAWYRDQQITLKLNTRVSGGSAREKFLLTEGGDRLAYDRLLLATGSRSFVPPIKGSDKRGVFALRSFKDAQEILSWAKGAKETVLIGGGLLGLEAGNALRKLGLRVRVVEFFPRLLPRQLDLEGAKRLQGIMEGMGFEFRLGAKTQEIAGEDKATGVLLEGGERLPAQMVIISAGVRPNLDLAKALGIDADKGVKVDERLRTNLPDVYSAGDVAEFKGMPYGIWTAATEQGQIAGANMAGGDAVYTGTTMANTLKVVGVDLASAGEIDAENKYESKVLVGEDRYKKIVLDQGRIIGCIMLGDKKGFTQITKLMGEKKDVTAIQDRILKEDFDFKKM
jgi:nitrite reductase (NADH) large subunit